MFTGSNTLLFVLLAGLLSGMAVLGFLYGLVLVFGGERARIRARVREYVTNTTPAEADPNVVRAQQRATLFAQLDSRWEDRSLFKSLQEDLEAADLHLTPTEFLFLQAGVGLGVGLVLWALVPYVGVILLPVGFIVSILAVRSYIRFLAKRRIERFEEQLPNNLAILAGSVRGGFSLFQALQLIAKEAAEPSKTEFTRVMQEISLGNTMGVSLNGLAKRIPTEDVDILVTAITMQQQTGGNLTHVLDVVAATVRERHRVEREIKTLTAQQRFSAVLLAALPFVMGLILFFISPSYISNLFQPGWVLCLPIGATIMCIVGFLVMRKMADIDV